MKDGHKIYFVTFSDHRYNAWKRLKKEAINVKWFDDVIAGDESIFESWYRKKYALRFKDRAFGYYQWKSYLVRMVMDQINENDILIYCDAGCVINKEGYKRFVDYINTVLYADSGILVFDQGMDVKAWTKRDIFAYFGDNNKYMNHGQASASLVIFKKCANAVAMIDEWYYICHNHYNLLTDNESILPNFDAFIENRSDQSILDILSIKYNAVRFTSGEIYTVDENWTKMKAYPFWAKRQRERRINLSNKIKKIIYKLVK